MKYGVVFLIVIVIGALFVTASSRGFTIDFIGNLQDELDDLIVFVECLNSTLYEINSTLYDMIISVNDTLVEHIEKDINVSYPTRFLGSEYENGDRPILVVVRLRLDRAMNGYIFVDAYIKSSSPANVVVSSVGLRVMGSAEAIHDTLSFIVPKNWFYRCLVSSDSSSSATLLGWCEVELR